MSTCVRTTPVPALDPTLARLTAGELAITAPKVASADSTLGVVRASFADPHVHLVLLVADGVLVGTLTRSDLPGAGADGASALAAATLRDRTVLAATPVAVAHRRLVSGGDRRLAVVDHDGRLRGLLCLRADGTAFCTDEGVAARACERSGGSA